MPLFYIYSQMLTDSSAEASALGSGPRGRRFKSALSENQKTTTCWCTTLSRKCTIQRRKQSFSIFYTPVSGSFLLKQHTTHCRNSYTISSSSCQMLTLLWKKYSLCSYFSPIHIIDYSWEYGKKLILVDVNFVWKTLLKLKL